MRKNISAILKSTPASDRVCKLIAERAEGVCLLGFSRGKDTLAAFLQLRRFFHTIIPFHVATVPHISFIDRSLRYYEKQFGVKIIRCASGDSQWLMRCLCFQPMSDEKALNNLVPFKYNNGDVGDVVKGMYEKASGKPLPDKGWVAFGISMHDSLFRRLRMEKLGDKAGYRESTRSFFPCFDWTTNQVLDAIELAGLKLPDDYLLSNRTLAVLDHSNLPRLKELFPEDYAKVKAMFPFINIILARNEFRKIRDKRELTAIRKEAGY